MEKSTISEVAKRTGLTLRALRFYEDKGLIAPERQGTKRLYSFHDEARASYIKALGAAGVPLVTVRKALEAVDAGANTNGMLSMVLSALEAGANERLDAIAALRKKLGIK